MKTKYLMISSSLFMGTIGVILSFIPDEVLEMINQTSSETFVLILQLAGALNFGFAITNWTAKANIIGGIYSKPLSIGNFSHFLIAGLALFKASIKNNNGLPTFIIALASVYLLFAILFGYILFTHPIKNLNNKR